MLQIERGQQLASGALDISGRHYAADDRHTARTGFHHLADARRRDAADAEKRSSAPHPRTLQLTQPDWWAEGALGWGLEDRTEHDEIGSIRLGAHRFVG